MSAPYRDASSLLAMADRARETRFAEEQRSIALARAGDRALRALAEQMFPADLARDAERWNMRELMRELWVRAYVQGFRDALLPNTEPAE